MIYSDYFKQIGGGASQNEFDVSKCQKSHYTFKNFEILSYSPHICITTDMNIPV